MSFTHVQMYVSCTSSSLVCHVFHHFCMKLHTGDQNRDVTNEFAFQGFSLKVKVTAIPLL